MSVNNIKKVLVVFKNSENTPVRSYFVEPKKQLGSVLSSFANDQKIDIEHYKFWNATEFLKPKRKRKTVFRVLTIEYIVGDKEKLVVHFARKCRDAIVTNEMKRENDLLEAEIHCQLLRYEMTKQTIRKKKAQVWIRQYRKRVAAAELRFTRKRARWLNTDWCTCELFKQSIRDADKQKRNLTKDLRDAEEHRDAKRARVGSVIISEYERVMGVDSSDDEE